MWMVLAVSRDLWSEWNKDLGTRLPKADHFNFRRSSPSGRRSNSSWGFEPYSEVVIRVGFESIVNQWLWNLGWHRKIHKRGCVALLCSCLNKEQQGREKVANFSRAITIPNEYQLLELFPGRGKVPGNKNKFSSLRKCFTQCITETGATLVSLGTPSKYLTFLFANKNSKQTQYLCRLCGLVWFHLLTSWPQVFRISRVYFALEKK
jgi:hypothetical protein